jgi:hypothetical protein
MRKTMFQIRTLPGRDTLNIGDPKESRRIWAGRPGFRPRVAVPFLLATVLLSVEPRLVRVSVADEPKPAVTTGQAERAKEPAPEVPRRVRPIGGEFMTALALWCAILVVGLALLTMVVVWGRSVRALARRKPIPPTAPDPLWYLKTKPPTPPAPAGSAPADPSRHSDDADPGSDISRQTPL